MSAQDDAELVRKGYEAFIAGDMVWLNEHLHENVVWHVPGHNVTSGDYRGRENVLGYFAKTVQIVRPTAMPAGSPMRSATDTNVVACHATAQRTCAGTNPSILRMARSPRRRRIDVTSVCASVAAPSRATSAASKKGRFCT